MPTSFLSADAGFPRLTADIPQEERLNRIENYLYMLLEQLRYTLYNLGKDNFNEAELKQIEEETGGPLYKIITDLEGNVATLETTASSLSATVSSLSGDVGSLELTAEALTARIASAEGDISSLELTASSLTTRVSNAEGNISIAQQTADKIGFIVKDFETATESSFELTSHMASLIADRIDIYGAVTFTDLATADGTTKINGDNILLKADADGDSTSHLEFLNSSDHSFGSLRTIDRTGSYNPYDDDVMFLIEAAGIVDGIPCGLRLNSGSNMVLETGRTLNLIGGDQIVMNCGSHPVIIQADTVSYASGWCPYGCYSFCDDGIYYGSTRIVAV